MAKNLIRSLGLVSAVALIPAATAALAAVDVNTYRELDQFMAVFERVRSEYVEQVDDKTLLRGAIDGMLNSLDPHSSYLDERGFKQLMTTTDGEYGGLGLSVTMEDSTVKVMSVTEDTPAERAGIKSGDYLTHIDGKLIYGGTLDEAVDQMKGPPGSTVSVTVLRVGRDKPFDVRITRAIIELKAVKWEIKDRVGIINVNGFNKTTTDATLAAMTAIEKSLGGKPLGYILDLRSNPGGLVLFRVEAGEMLTDDLGFRIALDCFRAGIPVGDPPLRIEHVDGIVADALDQQPEALLALEQRLIGQVPVGDVLGDLGEADQLSVRIADRIDDDMGAEALAVLAHAPALALELALFCRRLQDMGREARSAVLFGKEAREIPADDLLGLIALEPLRARIPGGDIAGRVQHVDGIIRDGADQQLKARIEAVDVERGLIGHQKLLPGMELATIDPAVLKPVSKGSSNTAAKPPGSFSKFAASAADS